MLPVMFKNSWFPTVFEDFLNTDFMPRANTTAPAVNVKEDEKAYTMEPTTCAVSSATRTTSRTTRCPRMWRKTRSRPKWRMAS